MSKESDQGTRYIIFLEGMVIALSFALHGKSLDPRTEFRNWIPKTKKKGASDE